VAINTQNVKLGTCRLIYGGIDFGATKGGVEVEVTTETHKSMIDQFGNVPVKEFILARNCVVRAPLAETTIEQINRVMPGSILTSNGTKATGTITLTMNPTDGDMVVVNGVEFTFRSSPQSAHDVAIGLDDDKTAANLAAALSRSVHEDIAVATYMASDNVVTITYKDAGEDGNRFTLATEAASVTLSGSTLSGGTNASKKKVEVYHGTGMDLLAIAKKLVLHPIALPATDRSEDFIIPFAGTAGAMSFAYKLDEERVFNVEFNAYPDAQTGVLFIVGDESA